MRIPKQLLSVACLLGTFIFQGAREIRASSWDKSFVMTVTEPIIAGNKVLTHGTYVWKLLDSPSDRHIVEISDQRTGHVETTILAMPKYRAVASSKNEVQFWETPAGVPRAVRTWFYPGDMYGQEFAYPEKLIAELASLSSQIPAPAPRSTIAIVPVPRRSAMGRHSVGAHTRALLPHNSAPSQPSWAAAANGTLASPPQIASVKRHRGLWDDIKNLPLTATLVPLIGLIGAGFLILFLFSLAKRKNEKQAVS